MNKMDLYKKIAFEIKSKLGPNHVSTILQIEKLSDKKDLDEGLPQFLVIVRDFDKFTLMMITNILREYPHEIRIPYVVEYRDVQGMLDSIPKPFLDIKKNYIVLEGEDVNEMVKAPSYEHFRAQMELILRNDILRLRRNLILVMSQQITTQEHIKELSIVALNGIRGYYQLVEPDLQTIDELITRFNKDFPMGKKTLQKILECAYRTIKGMDVTEDDVLQLILSTFDNVLQPLLIEVGALEAKLEDETKAPKDSKGPGALSPEETGKTITEPKKLSFEEFIKTYGKEISNLQKAMAEQFEREHVNKEQVLRGELELKFRKREKSLKDKHKDEIKSITDKYEAQLTDLKLSFEKEIEGQSEEFVKKKMVEERKKIENEFGEKIKVIREELELKYITTDLQEKEDKLQNEFRVSEKNLRDNYRLREEELRHEFEVKEKNLRESIESEYNTKLEIETAKLENIFNERLNDDLNRRLRAQERKYRTDMARREKALEKELKKDFKKREKELHAQFNKDLQTKEKEAKIKFQLEYEREKGKLESRKSAELLKFIKSEVSNRYKEIEKVQMDLIKAFQTEKINNNVQNFQDTDSISRNFVRPPKKAADDDELDLFSKILRDNVSLSRSMRKKNLKKVT